MPEQVTLHGGPADGESVTPSDDRRFLYRADNGMEHEYFPKPFVLPDGTQKDFWLHSSVDPQLFAVRKVLVPAS